MCRSGTFLASDTNLTNYTYFQETVITVASTCIFRIRWSEYGDRGCLLLIIRSLYATLIYKFTYSLTLLTLSHFSLSTWWPSVVMALFVDDTLYQDNTAGSFTSITHCVLALRLTLGCSLQSLFIPPFYSRRARVKKYGNMVKYDFIL